MDANQAQQPSTHDLPVQYRAASFVPSTYNEADNTIDVVWTTGARRRAYDWWNDTVFEEELVVEPGAVDMTRFEAGTVQVLDNHNTWAGVSAILGIAQSGSIADGEGRAKVRFGQREEIRGVVQDIINGTIRAISFGYSVERYEITRAQDRTDGVNLPLYRAVAWTPMEISFVTVPADGNASTRNTDQRRGAERAAPCIFSFRAAAQPTGENSMQQESNAQGGNQPATQQRAAEPAATVAAPAAAPAAAEPAAPAAGASASATEAQRAADAANARAADITTLCARHGLSERAAEFIRSGQSIGEVSRTILEELAVRDAATGGQRNARVSLVGSELETRQAGIAEALQHRMDARTKLTDNGRQFRGMSLLEIGREMLERGGINTRGMDRMRLAAEMIAFRSGGMQGTSDFANILSNVANKRLRGTYEENPGTFTRWARRAPNAPDFKAMTVAQIGAMPDLLKVNEHGEFTYGKFKDGAESYSVLTYGRIVSLSRQAIVNDDLRAFDRIVTGFGYSAARLENRVAYAEITNNAALSDGTALFHANHANLGTGAGSALSFDALSAGRKAMRKQKGLASEELNLAPAYLIVPSDLEQLAYQLTSNNYVPAKQTDVNEFRTGGRTALEPIVEPVLDANSTTAWYLAANNGQVDTVEYCWLDGAEGPVIEQETAFEVDGISLKCREDFAAKALDYHGLYKAAGA